MVFLQEKGRFRSNFLFDYESIMKGDNKSILTFLSDIYSYYHSRILKFKIDEENNIYNEKREKIQNMDNTSNNNINLNAKFNLSNHPCLDMKFNKENRKFYNRTKEHLSQKSSRSKKSNLSKKSNKSNNSNITSNSKNSRKNCILWIYEWFKAINFNEGLYIDFTKDKINEFKDGTILTKLLNIFQIYDFPNENYKTSIKNRSSIKYCLDILKQVKNFPYNYLFFDEEISNGNGEIIRGLLKQIKEYFC